MGALAMAYNLNKSILCKELEEQVIRELKCYNTKNVKFAGCEHSFITLKGHGATFGGTVTIKKAIKVCNGCYKFNICKDKKSKPIWE